MVHAPSMSEPLNPSPILQTAFGFWNSKVLLTAVELGLFTKLNQRRLSASELLNDSYWPVMAIDDTNHDGRADITVQNSSTGQIDHLFFTGTTLTASQLDAPAFPGSAVVDASLSFNHLIPLV